MHIREFVERVLIIENREEEIQTLCNELKAQDIDVMVFNPQGEQDPFVLNKNRQLVFVDLMLDENSAQYKSNISRLVSTLCIFVGDSFGPYGIVIWSKHPEFVELFKRKVTEAVNHIEQGDNREEDELNDMPSLGVPPMFIVSLNKNVYIERGNYNGVLADVDNKVRQSKTGYFFMSWSTSVKKTMQKTISDVYGMCSDYSCHEQQLTYLLYKLAQNHTGIPSSPSTLTSDCYKSFDEILCADLFMQQKEDDRPLFEVVPENPWMNNNAAFELIKSQLNSKICLDFEAIAQDVIVPGNVYKLKGDSLQQKVMDKAKSKEDQDVEPYVSIDVAIELTPPCDASNKKVSSRIITGYVFCIPGGMSKSEINFLNNKLKADNKYCLKNVMIDGKPQVMVFEYRYLFTPLDADLKDSNKYEVWFRAKPKLFADILQKFSSHAARLGLSDIH